jgi:hypothetical protein
LAFDKDAMPSAADEGAQIDVQSIRAQPRISNKDSLVSDMREYGASDTKHARPGIPHNMLAPALSQLQETVEPVDGLSYQEHSLIPPGKYRPGVYADQDGRRWFVKRGVVHSVGHLHNLFYNSVNHDEKSTEHIDSTPLTQNASARHEYVIH